MGYTLGEIHHFWAYNMLSTLLSLTALMQLSRLILIAEKDKVYEKFPIPLINRLEKHLVTSSIIMRAEQQMFCDELKQWVERMADVPGTNFKKEDVFVGYQSETPVAVVFQAYKMCPAAVAVFDDEWEERVCTLLLSIGIEHCILNLVSYNNIKL